MQFQMQQHTLQQQHQLQQHQLQQQQQQQQQKPSGPAKVLFINLLAVVFLVSAILDLAGAQTQERYCGERLNDVLDDVCPNGFNSLSLRSTRSVPTAAVLSPAEGQPKLGRVVDDGGSDSDAMNGLNPLLLALWGREADMVHTRRVRQGIASKCCKLGCSYEELSLVCRLYRK